MTFSIVWYFLVLLEFLVDSKRGLLGASLGRPLGVFGRLWGVFAASLQRPRLGHPKLGLDLAKLG